jgi:bZIP transcription factor/Minimal binding motif of Hap4 for binding to Hap2/3/5
MGKASSSTTSPPVLAPAGNGDSQSSHTVDQSVSPTAPPPVTSAMRSLSPPPTSLTSREWIIPPRPKPGRKPATDAPPTKRKAQNRAAQRAFRERRAARVGELEEELKRIEVEDEEEQNALRARIENLEKEVSEYRTGLAVWMQRCRTLEAELAIENAAKQEALRPSEEILEAPALFPPSPNHQSPNGPLKAPPNQGGELMGCGNCSSINNCQCIQEVINMQSLDPHADDADSPSNKRPYPPDHNQPTFKRIKAEPSDHLETDFTSSFSKRPGNNSGEDSASPISPSAVVDPCGFCTDDTPCICAEMQAEADASNISNNHRSHNHDRTHTNARNLELQPVPQQSDLFLPTRVSELAHITPPPSDTDVSLSTSSFQPQVSVFPNPCITGPGTCLQCQSDPNSTLFCKSLAKSREQQQIIASNSPPQQQISCCGANEGSAGSCCQSGSQTQSLSSITGKESGPGIRTRSSSQNLNTTTTFFNSSNSNTKNTNTKDKNENASGLKEQATQQPIITLTCADTYTTLSRHPGYARATGDMARWLPTLLHPIPIPIPTPNQDPILTHTPANPRPNPRPNTNNDKTAGNAAPAPAPAEAGGLKAHATAAATNGVGVSVRHAMARPALEIDAANVMAVLRDFDRRFA